MLTKQSRQFEQWAQDKETLMSIKAKIAAEKQTKTLTRKMKESSNQNKKKRI